MTYTDRAQIRQQIVHRKPLCSCFLDLMKLSSTPSKRRSTVCQRQAFQQTRLVSFTHKDRPVLECTLVEFHKYLCNQNWQEGRPLGWVQTTWRGRLSNDRLLLVGQDRRCSILGDLCRAGVVDALPQLQQGNIAIVCHHVQVVPGQMHAPLHRMHLPKHQEHQGDFTGQGEKREGGGLERFGDWPGKAGVILYMLLLAVPVVCAC